MVLVPHDNLRVRDRLQDRSVMLGVKRTPVRALKVRVPQLDDVTGENLVKLEMIGIERADEPAPNVVAAAAWGQSDP